MKAFYALCGLFFSGLVCATPLNNIVVFGDSLSDNGNLYEFMGRKLPQSPPYYLGRFSNGPIWVEHLAKSYFGNDYSAHLFDYAFGGAGVSADGEDDEDLFSLRREISVYLSGHEGKADENSLFIVWMGANNYLGLPDDAEEALAVVNNGIARDIQYLIDAGAKHVLVANLPDLGTAPVAKELRAKELLSYFSQRHNELLLSALARLQVKNPDVQFIHYDANNEVKKFIESPEKYGYKNVTESCYDTKIDKSGQNALLHMVANVKQKAENDSCDDYLFFDRVHPTAPAHQVFAEQTRILLDSLGVEFSR